ncbi:MAG TPA: hypothetical protein VEL05_00715, partial [Candidatus Acidoferrum sp.]|nr:hypothetical protein [Candidatus Acidoferrum sp.]
MRSVFVGTGAFVGRVDHLTRLAFWADEPTDHDFDPSRLITVELSRTPNAAASQQISWDAVEVDDCLIGPNGGLAGTTIGPRWPEMQLVGAVYIEESVVRRLPPQARPSCPPKGMGGRDYEFKTVVYWSHLKDGRAGRRYIGHHAEILEEAGKLARVAVFKPGMSDQPNAVATTMWIDLSSPDACDAGPDGLTQIGVGGGARAGALFLAAGRVIDGRAAPATDLAAGRAGLAHDGPSPIHADPKLPPFKGESDLAPGEGGPGVASPKIPPFVGEGGEMAGVSSPKIPALAGEGEEVAGAPGPKLPPFVGEGQAIAVMSSPKVPAMAGEGGETAGVSSPKLPPLAGEAGEMGGRSEPKLPPFRGMTGAG